jgi:signal transduction histidine kinase/CheY-like chemotaxis protein
VGDIVTFMQNADAAAFLLLGVAVAVSWLRNRDRSTGWLALAIVLLSLVSIIGRVSALTQSLFQFSLPLMSQVSLVGFVGSGYALLRYRASLIPLPRAWHRAVVVVMAGITIAFLIATAVAAPAGAQLWIAVGLIVVWSATVIEPIVRFWLVARGLPAVQAWRLRSLSLGFAGLVAVLLFVVVLLGARASTTNPGVQLGIQVLVLAIVPLLYASFSPPSWLRREWRASEEDGVRRYLESLLLADEDTETLTQDALEWATRLSGGAAAVAFDGRGAARASLGMDEATLGALRAHLSELPEGISRNGLHGGGAALISLPILSPDGNGRLVIVSGPFTPAFGSDELSRTQQFMSAVTAGLDRKRLVTELRDANRQLKEANEHKSVFLANMSHELRTPLNAIIGFSELLLDAKESQFDRPTQKRFLAQVHSSGKHLLGLINDILDLSKVEAGQMELRLQTVAVETVVTQVLNIVEPLAVQKHITLDAHAGDAGEVMADAGKLKQMLLNLVSNAIKFTPDGGTVTITGKRVPSAVEIAIADTGIGIPESEQGQIFREFHQVDQGPGRAQQGTGLGLALTRRFALLHGGEVRVTSKLGSGSVFTLRLPVQAAVPALGQATAPSQPAEVVDTTRPLVLVIEDDVAAAELITRQLEGAGFRTHIARTGTEAVAKARALRPAAITLDILLPELDGWEVITRLKRDEATSDIPVVIVSVVDNPDLGMALGALDYFVKPVDGKELVDRLSRFKLKPTATNGATDVLVVDDEAANRQWLTRILEPAGFNVILASGGREAIELARASPPDLVLLDLMMPEVTGFDVVEALRADPNTRETPIMILTARHLTEADKTHLNGHVSTILSRGSLGASDIVGMLRHVVEKRGSA